MIDYLEQKVIGDTIRVNHPTLAAIVNDPAQGGYKIFWEHIPDVINPPLIVISRIAGGYDMRAIVPTASISFWKVVGVTGNMTTALTMSKLIQTLHMGDMYIEPGLEAASNMSARLHQPVFDRSTHQNTPLFQVGGIFRISITGD